MRVVSGVGTAGSMNSPSTLTALTTGSLAAGVALGVDATLGTTRRPAWTRRLHQASLLSGSTLLAVLTVSEARSRRGAAVAHGAALLALGALPLTSGGDRRHVGLAIGACILHAAGTVLRRRS